MNFFDRFKAATRWVFLNETPVSQENLAWFKQTLDLLPKPFFLLDSKSQRITFSNASARRMMGMDYTQHSVDASYERKFFLYRPDGIRVPAEELPSVRVLRGEKVDGEQFTLLTDAGEFTIKVYSEEIPRLSGLEASALIVFQDITALKKVETNLRAAQEDLKRAIDIAQIGFWSVDTQKNITTLSPLLLEQFNMKPADFDGHLETVLQVIHEADRERVATAIQRSITERVPYHIEYRIVHKDGSVRWIEAKSDGLTSADPYRLTGTTLDITEQKQMEQRLDEARRIAESASSAKSQFLANMSHEIRTPLGAVVGFSALLKENGLSRPEREEFVSIIERNSSQLMRIIDDILDLSKVEAGMMQIEHIDFSLPEMLTDFFSLMAYKAREKGILFRVQVATELPSIVSCDPTRLRQILFNVVGNAIKFTDKGYVELRVRYQNENLHFEVEDSGRGISPEQARNLFRPFSQADESTTRKFGGTGLGLVLTRNLAEALGGYFLLKKSALGQGSIFEGSVKAPPGMGSQVVAGLDFEEAPERVVQTTGQLSGMKILLVEDSADNQALISIYLTRAGAQVDVVSDGARGVSSAQSMDYHVILMDVQMPVMDGLTAVRTLRSQGYQKPIVALTAHAMKEERERCLAAGFDHFCSKPVDRGELIETLQKYKKS